jgi:hypothetical protein
MQAQSQYPIKVTWRNDTQAMTYVVTRELELREDNPHGFTPEEIDAITQALVARQKTNVVIETPEEARLVVKLLREHINGIAHPRNGCTWATPSGRRSIERRIEQIEDAADL